MEKAEKSVILTRRKSWIKQKITKFLEPIRELKSKKRSCLQVGMYMSTGPPGSRQRGRWGSHPSGPSFNR